MFLVRKKLRLIEYECFQFVSQKSAHNYYYFEEYQLTKVEFRKGACKHCPSSVGLNYLLSDDCKIVKIKDFD
jgi:hypothetical protein